MELAPLVSAQLDGGESDARTPRVLRLEPVLHVRHGEAGLAQARRDGIARRRIVRLEGEPGETGTIRVAAPGALAVPDISGEVVVVAARGHERGAATCARDVEADEVAVESLGGGDVADAQVHV